MKYILSNQHKRYKKRLLHKSRIFPRNEKIFLDSFFKLHKELPRNYIVNQFFVKHTRNISNKRSRNSSYSRSFYRRIYGIIEITEIQLNSLWIDDLVRETRTLFSLIYGFSITNN